MKKDIQYRNREYEYDSLRAQLVINESTWSPNHIKNRSLEILDFILFKLDEDQNKLSIKEKVALLGLNFLSKNLEQLDEVHNVEYQ